MKGDWFGNWHGWDPISSGEGDLSLDDIGKCLSAAHKAPKKSNGNDAMSVADGMLAGFLQSKDQFPISGWSSVSLDTAPFFFGSVQLGTPATTDKSLKQSDGLDAVLDADGMPLIDTSLKGPISCGEGDLMSPITVGMTLTGSTPLKDQISHNEGVQMPPYDSDTCIPTIQNREPSYECDQRPINSNGVDVLAGALNNTFESTDSDNCFAGSKYNVLLPDDSLTLLTPAKDIEHSAACNEDLEHSNALDIVSISIGMPYVTSSLNESLIMSSAANAMVVCEDHNENTSRSNMLDSDLASCDLQMEGSLTEREKRVQLDVTAVSNMPLQKDFPKIELQDQGDERVPLVDDIMLEEAFDEMGNIKKGGVVPVADDLILEEVVEMKVRKQEVGAPHRNGVLLHKGRPGTYDLSGINIRDRSLFCWLNLYATCILIMKS